MTVKPDEISRLLLERLEEYSFNKDLEETGTVIHIGDGISHVHGLLGCMSGELLEFANGDIGMALNLEEDNVSRLTAARLSMSGKRVPSRRRPPASPSASR